MIRHVLAGVLASCALAFAPSAMAMETLRAVASIKPIHSLVAARHGRRGRAETCLSAAAPRRTPTA